MSVFVDCAELNAPFRGLFPARFLFVNTTAEPHARPAFSGRAQAWLLGLHGIVFMAVFPMGPQQSRLWHPGLPGIGALVAAFPVAAMIGGLVARRLPRLPAQPRILGLLAAAGLLPVVFSTDYPTFFLSRVIAGLSAGVGVVAVYRALPADRFSSVSGFAARVIVCGMPPCLFAATLMDWRAAFAPVCVAFVLVAIGASPRTSSAVISPRPRLTEAAPASLAATAALAFVSASYLTVLSGFLVGNAGHTELHIPCGLLVGGLLSFAIPSVMTFVNRRWAARKAYAVFLAASIASLSGLLLMQNRLHVAAALSLIGLFLAINTTRHLSLGGLVRPLLREEDVPAHHTHTYLSHCLGSGLGALFAGHVIHPAGNGSVAGMKSLYAAGVAATVLALAAGWFAAHPNAAPAARAAFAKSRWRVAASFARSVRASITRRPGMPT